MPDGRFGVNGLGGACDCRVVLLIKGVQVSTMRAAGHMGTVPPVFLA